MLTARFCSISRVQDSSEHFEQISEAVQSVASSIQDSLPHKSRTRSISPTSIRLLDADKSVSAGYNIQCDAQIPEASANRERRNDGEQRWIGRCREAEKSMTIENIRGLYRLIRNSGTRKPKLNKVIGEFNDTQIHFQDCWLALWVEHFREQLSWLMTRVDLPLMLASEIMKLDTGLPSEVRVIRRIGFIRRHKSGEPDGLSPFFVKEGSELSALELIKRVKSAWEKKEISND